MGVVESLLGWVKSGVAGWAASERERAGVEAGAPGHGLRLPTECSVAGGDQGGRRQGTVEEHTQGPWRVKGPSAKGYLVIVGARGEGVALVMRDSVSEEADAAVIAEAPTMLALLKESLEHGTLEEGSELRRRIADAVGRCEVGDNLAGGKAERGATGVVGCVVGGLA